MPLQSLQLGNLTFFLFTSHLLCSCFSYDLSLPLLCAIACLHAVRLMSLARFVAISAGLASQPWCSVSATTDGKGWGPCPMTFSHRVRFVLFFGGRGKICLYNFGPSNIWTQSNHISPLQMPSNKIKRITDAIYLYELDRGYAWILIWIIFYRSQ